ncbi:hypothetical protein RGUI_4031 [Rhodovulum sp. P5]|uniref:hypothetical protein n=1 Tax=Rhodovulum sp. P5 TaxID=1564506 RepID=UPI0009C25B15|nr:hypothetical protein [Rhodovulum sp. P5]ARE42172.1 hypothetical protein RGUI_4031 [Rhodovulum sp. P5]
MQKHPNAPTRNTPTTSNAYRGGSRTPTRYERQNGNAAGEEEVIFRPRFHDTNTLRWLISSGTLQPDHAWLVASSTEDGCFRIMQSSGSRLHAEQISRGLNDANTGPEFEAVKLSDVPWVLQVQLSKFFAELGIAAPRSKPRHAA